MFSALFLLSFSDTCCSLHTHTVYKLPFCERAQTQFPAKVLLQAPVAESEASNDGLRQVGWWRAVYGNFVHSNEGVRHGALGLAERTVSLMAELDTEPRSQLNEAALEELISQGGILHKLNAMMHGKKGWGKDAERVALAAAAAWGWMARFAEAKIVKEGHGNAFLKVMEPAFEHKAASVRQTAFKSWFHLACVFDSMNSTLAHPKRLELICRPFRTTWPNDQSADVRMTATIVWSHLLLLLTRRCSVEKSTTFEVAVCSVIKAAMGETESPLRVHMIDIIGGLLYAKKDSANSSTGSLLVLPDVPATNLALRTDFVKTKHQIIFNLLLDLGVGSEAGRVQMSQAWSGFMTRLAAEEDRDSVDVLSRAAVQFWTGCMLGTNHSLATEKMEEADISTRKEVALRIVGQFCSTAASSARILFCTNTPLQYMPAEAENSVGSHNHNGIDGAPTHVKLAPYLAGAVSIAAQEMPELGSQALEKILALFPNDPRAYRQLFEVIAHVALTEPLVKDAAMPMRFWLESVRTYSASLDASRHVLSSPGQAKMQAPVLAVVLAQVLRLIPASADISAKVDAAHGRELEKHWAGLFEQLREVAKSKSSGHSLGAAVKVCSAMSKNNVGCLEIQAAHGIRHLDFVLGVMLDEAWLETAGANKSKIHSNAAEVCDDHPLQSIVELWVLAFRSGYRAFEEKRIDLAVLKSIISRLRPILDQMVAVEARCQGPLGVLAAPITKCLSACSRQGNKAQFNLGSSGSEGILDEVEGVWTKMAETILKGASCSDIGVLSPLLVSALSNSNTRIQHQAVQVWNDNFGSGAEKSSIPATLQYCLKKLSKRVHISMPQNAEDRNGSGSPTNNEDSQMGVSSLSQEPLTFADKSPVRIMNFQNHGKGSLLSKRDGSRAGSRRNTPSCSPAKAAASGDKTEVKSEALMSEDARDVDYVQIANTKRKLLLTEHQREARKEARKAAGGLGYTSLEDPESRMAGVDGEMLLMPSDSRSHWGGTSDNMEG